MDYGLIKDLGLRMSDLQCRKLFFAGEKLRILGKVSTSVQCTSDGSPLGNLHFKAHVVEDLKKVFNTHSIASEKLHKKFDTSFQSSKDNSSTEPTEDEKEAVEKKPKKKRKKKDEEKAASPKTEQKSTPTIPDSPSPPRPVCQGNWTRYQSYNGWHPEHGFGGPRGMLRDCYEDRRTGETQGEKPENWESDGSLHSLQSAASPVFSDHSDEYHDNYTNISTIRHYDQSLDVAPNIPTIANLCPASPETIVKRMTDNCKQAGMNAVETTKALQCAGVHFSQQRGMGKKPMIADGKFFTKEDLQHVSKLRREGKDVPISLQHVPNLHGPSWCHAGCTRRKPLPHKCGYHASWGVVTACCPDCNGGYCDHYQDDPDNYLEQGYEGYEDGMP